MLTQYVYCIYIRVGCRPNISPNQSEHSKNTVADMVNVLKTKPGCNSATLVSFRFELEPLQLLEQVLCCRCPMQLHKSLSSSRFQISQVLTFFLPLSRLISAGLTCLVKDADEENHVSMDLVNSCGLVVNLFSPRAKLRAKHVVY